MDGVVSTYEPTGRRFSEFRQKRFPAWSDSSSCRREVSPKNRYRFGISLEFADRAAYERYDTHPEHERFGRERWLAEVDDFLEIDYATRVSDT